MSSLPPTPRDDTPQPASASPEKWLERPPVGHPDRSWWLPDDSKVKAAALQIIAMRIAGHEDREIAQLMDISEKSISPYVYRATKNGWLNIDYNPKERLNLQVMHRVVENLEEGLNSKNILATGMRERTHVALKMAEGTIFKSFDNAPTQEKVTTVVAVQVIMPDGPRQQIRDETTGGTPAYIDAGVK